MKFVGYLLCFFVAFATPVHQVRAQAAVAAVATIGGALDGLKDVVKQLETSASFLLAQGNNSLAQQQMLLAGILSRTIEQVTVAYADSLNRTFDQLNVMEQNAFNDLFSMAKQLNGLEKQTAKDVQAIIYKTQGAANQVLNRIPLVKKAPVFYGITARDMTADPAQNPADLEILGFLFADDRLKFKKPVLKVAGQLIPNQLISVQEDRIQVQLPDDLKAKIGFAAGPCNPRKTFAIALEVFYAVPRGFWPISWNSEQTTGFNANALAGSDQFDAIVLETGTRISTSQRSETFAVRSGNVQVGCEEGGNGAARFEGPSDAIEINCSAGWVDTSNLRTSAASACTVGGTVASATGAIRGLDRDCIGGGLLPRICNCRGGGHGYLAINGTYKVPVSDARSFSDATVGRYVMKNGHLSAALETDSAVKRTKIAVVLKRKGCGAEFDKIALTVPQNPLQAVTQSSDNGHFKATFRAGQLTIESIQQ